LRKAEFCGKLSKNSFSAPTKRMSTCIIGDIHGCCETLTELLTLVEQRADSFIFLGDYIDRGPDSRGVVDCILDFRQTHPQTIALRGNHEQMLLYYLNGYDPATFLKAGGRETLASYGISPDAAPKDAAKLLPEAHKDFFANLPLHWEDTYGIYVHAGLEPGVHLSRQIPGSCLWIRDEFIRSQHRFDKLVVFGHTIFRKPLVQRNKIGIDTGAVYGGKLTALLLPEREFVSIEAKEPSYAPEVSADLEGLFQEGTGGFGLGKLFSLFR
jgi:serine/threonine protein phosphatase 1